MKTFSRRSFIKNTLGLASAGIAVPSLSWRSADALTSLQHAFPAGTQRTADVPIREAGVRMLNGSPVVVINGEPVYLACHHLRHYQPQMGARWPEDVKHAVREFAARGIHRFEAQVDLGWKGMDEFDPAGVGVSSPIDPMMTAIIEADPRAQVVLRIGAHNLLPEFLPAEFKAHYADELETDQTGKKYSVSFASDKGFEILTGVLTRLVRYAEAQPYAGHLAGYTIFLEFEGVPWGSAAEGAFTDYSPAMLAAWRAHLQARYQTDAALQAAWGDSASTFATATLPTPDEHLGGDARLIFHDPIKGRKARDYYALMDELTIRRHRQVARAVKAACNNKKLVGMIGGYVPDAGEPRSIASPTGFPELQLHKQHFSGPGCWSRAFEIPEIDFYLAPRDYLNTGIGGVCLPLHPPASLRLHGKVAWLEDDQRTYLHHGIFNPELRDARESIMAHRRNAAVLYTECAATDWMEQTQNWLIDPPLLNNLGQINSLLQESVKAPDFVPDAFCVLFDEESEGWTKPTIRLDEELFYHQRNAGWSYCGVPLRFHLLNDLALPGFPSYKFFILPNAYHWTADKEKLIARIKRDGNVLLWMYGAGYAGESTLDVRGMEHVTGIRIAAEPHPWEHRISITDFTHPIMRDLPGDCTFGTSRRYGPIFRVDDTAARILGRSFGFQMKRDAGFAVKTFGKGARGDGGKNLGAGDYASVYCEAPGLPAGLMRGMARYAGCHVYLESDDFLTVGKDIIMVHAAKPGPRVLSLPRRCDVVDWFSGKKMATATTRFNFTLDPAETRVFKVSP
jgi:hypothetical protein